VALLAVLAAASVSCAYYNTFYLARKYYMKATDGQPYEVDREGSLQRTNYNKSADYSKKLLGVHPNSKWVDDAWLMWARTFIGTDDPLKAVAMLEEFQTRFPKSDLKPDAEFFLGLAYRAARRHETAVDRFNNFLAQAPKDDLVPYAYYERSKALMSLQRYKEAAESAGQILERFPKHRLADRALRQRAEARYQQRDWKGARADFRTMGDLALNDDDRLRFLLREVDCLESARELDEARGLLRDARSHVQLPPPVPPELRTGPNASGSTVQQVRTVNLAPGQDRYGKLTLRMGSVELLAGNEQEAIRLFESVLQDYPRTPLAAEAQFRIGFSYETGLEDFSRARAEYAKVKEQAGSSPFAVQAQQRTDNLARLERFRTATGSDSLARQAEAKFLIAEHFLFNLDRPERALEEYQQIADSTKDSSVVARALTAQGWVLARKLDRRKGADSLFWKVVREYPGTYAQLAARDYLEADGQTVDERLIVAPEFEAPVTFEPELTQAPGQTPKLGQIRTADPGVIRYNPGGIPPGIRPNAASDSIRLSIEMRDSLLSRSRRDTTEAGVRRTTRCCACCRARIRRAVGAMLAAFDRSRPKPAPTAAQPPPGAVRNDEPGAHPSAPSGVAAGGAAATGAAAGTAGASAAPKSAAAGSTSAPSAAGGAGTAGTTGAPKAGAAAGGAATTGSAGGTAAATGAAAGTAAATGAAVKAMPTTSDTSAKKAATSSMDSASARADTSAKHVVPASTAAVAPASVAATKPAPAFTGSTPAAPPAKPTTTSMSLTSWAKKVKLTPAQKDSVIRAKVLADSLKHARSDSLKLEKAKAKAASDSAKGKS
jgi:tetratricopeptide (TPR) repeat protein